MSKKSMKNNVKVIYINFPKGKRGFGKGEQEKYAVFSSAVYPDINGGDINGFLNKYGYSDFKYDEKLSNKNTGVFHNNKTGETIISFRGTDWGKISDIWQNIGILTGNPIFKSRTRSNNKLYDKVEKKYGKDITLTGHSAGGYQATEVSAQKGAKAVVYNSASGPNQTEFFKFLKAKDNITHYTTNNPTKGVIDIVSLINPYKKEVVDKKDDKDAHDIKNFTPEEEKKGEGKDKNKKYCRKCKKYLLKSNWSRHIISKSHLK